MNTSVIDENKYLISADLALVTTLSLFFPIQSIDKSIPRKAQFVFQKTRELEQAVSDYWQQKLSVEPQAYFNQLKFIKARLYSQE
ncbi:hypothetical protein HY409_03115 [Candidatus Gottesmanbacteria bacterium]|nr:hypothetical protein [Candidatus Gottesmanbacteria bacterium]